MKYELHQDVIRKLITSYTKSVISHSCINFSKKIYCSNKKTC